MFDLKDLGIILSGIAVTAVVSAILCLILSELTS